MSSDKEKEWPVVKGNPVAFFQAPGVLEKSTRTVAGPLRRGTERSVGPRKNPQVGGSDFGLDRMEHRPFDAIGQKYPESDPAVRSISSQLRKERE